jgi:hypothetical protein
MTAAGLRRHSSKGSPKECREEATIELSRTLDEDLEAIPCRCAGASGGCLAAVFEPW